MEFAHGGLTSQLPDIFVSSQDLGFSVRGLEFVWGSSLEPARKDVSVTSQEPMSCYFGGPGT